MIKNVQKCSDCYLYSVLNRLHGIETELIGLATMNNELYNYNQKLKRQDKISKDKIKNLKIVLNNLINEANKYLPRENHFEFDCMRKAQIELNKGR